MNGRVAVGIILGGVVFLMLLSAIFYVLVRRGDVAPPPQDSHLQIMMPRLEQVPGLRSLP